MVPGLRAPMRSRRAFVAASVAVGDTPRAPASRSAGGLPEVEGVSKGRGGVAGICQGVSGEEAEGEGEGNGRI